MPDIAAAESRQRALEAAIDEHLRSVVLETQALPSAVRVRPARVGLTMRQALREIGLPGLPDLSPEEELVELLKWAAEIEHGLMVQYLYAAYSARDKNIRRILGTTAHEEMGHLITVQHLLLACGAKPHFGRYDWANSSIFAPFPLRLEPVSRLSIAKYAVCEMPDQEGPYIDDEQLQLLGQIFGDAILSGGGGGEERRIGLLYMKIYWSFRPNDTPRADPQDEPWDGYPVAEVAAKLPGHHVSEQSIIDRSSHHAVGEDWRGSYNPNVIVRPIAERADALAAVSAISEQGEGFGWSPTGHFDRFVEAYKRAKSDQQIAYDVPINPWYKENPLLKGDSANEITSHDGIRFAKMGNMLYEAILLSIPLYLLLPPTKRIKASISAMECMAELKALGLSIVDIERQVGKPAVAGLAFSKPPEVNLDDPRILILRVKNLVDGLLLQANEIIMSPETPRDRKNTARSLAKRLTDKVRPVIDDLARTVLV